ncbi:MAG: hypothetical protein PHI12_12575 [Dehalococcoidales bacterium]|nr:hypothetical protein [Dehalococcoidales bacterium]
MKKLIEKIENRVVEGKEDYDIVLDKDFDMVYKGYQLRRWHVRRGGKSIYRIDDERRGYRVVSVLPGESLSHGVFHSFDLAVAKVASLIDATVNAFGEKYDVTPRKKGGEWSTIEVR